MRRLPCLLLLAACAGAWASTVTATLEPSEIPFHLTAQLTLRVEAAPGARIDVSKVEALFKKLELEFEPTDAIERIDDTTERAVFVYTLDAVESKTYALTPLEVTVDESETLRIPGPSLRVRDLTPEEEAALEFVENAPPVVLAAPWRRWAAPVLAALLAVLAVAYFIRRRYRAAASLAPAAAPRPAWEIALERLQRVEQSDWSRAGSWNPFYVELSGILRAYIEDRFLIHAPEQTTPEFLAEAAGSGALSEEQQRSLASFLRHSDLVKFAKYEPGQEEMRSSFDVVKRFVEETIPLTPPVEGAAA